MTGNDHLVLQRKTPGRVPLQCVLAGVGTGNLDEAERIFA